MVFSLVDIVVTSQLIYLTDQTFSVHANQLTQQARTTDWSKSTLLSGPACGTAFDGLPANGTLL